MLRRCVYLLVDFSELFQVVLKEGDLLLLSRATTRVVRVHLSALKNSVLFLYFHSVRYRKADLHNAN